MANEMPNRDAVVARIREVALPSEIQALLDWTGMVNTKKEPAKAVDAIIALRDVLRASATAQQQQATEVERLREQRDDLSVVDSVLSRRNALDGVPDRIEKIRLLLKIAQASDPKAVLATALVRAEQAEQAREALKVELTTLKGHRAYGIERAFKAGWDSGTGRFGLSASKDAALASYLKAAQDGGQP